MKRCQGTKASSNEWTKVETTLARLSRGVKPMDKESRRRAASVSYNYMLQYTGCTSSAKINQRKIILIHLCISFRQRIEDRFIESEKRS